MTKELVKMDLRKVGLDTVIDLKIDAEIEAYFREASKVEGVISTETSSKWLDGGNNGLQFYRKGATMSDKVQVEGVHVIDNFGNGLLEYREGFEGPATINVAILRAVGASTGISIKVDELVGYDEIRKYLQLFGVWIKQFYMEYLRATPVQTSITVEI